MTYGVDERSCLADIVVDNARRYRDVPAYVDGVRIITHGQLFKDSQRVARALRVAGVTAGDRVAVMGRNSIEFGTICAATQLSGITLVPVSFRSSPVEVLDALLRVNAKIVFCDAEFSTPLTDATAMLDPRPRLVCFDAAADSESLAEFVQIDDDGSSICPARAEDIAYLLFTSGTTGAAKCCVIGQFEMHEIAWTMNGEMRTGCTDRALINMPMFHIGALAIIGGIHARGGTVVLQKHFDAGDALRLIGSHGVTVLHLAPTMLMQLLTGGGSAATLSGVRTVVYSAAPMTTETLKRAMTSMPGAGFLNLYGQTEAIVSGLPREFHNAEGPDADLLASVGIPFPGVRVQIADDEGRELPTGCPGEILVRSDMAFRGYWNDPSANRAAFHDGWYRTGDIGRLDERGVLFLVDRKKDVIITGGENVYSPEVENAVLELDEVQQCAVIGVPDTKWGETVCAVVVWRDGAVLTLDAVAAAVRTRLASFKVPRLLASLDALPMLPSGKVDKKRLRDWYRTYAEPGCP